MQTRFASALACAALLFTLPACDSDGGSDPDPLAAARANVGNWTWIEIEGSQCRDGSATGIGVRLQPGASDLAIYLEGGGACFNQSTCSTNPASFGASDFAARMNLVGNAALFNTASSTNPVAGWNMVYVPYCTGDVHTGSTPNNNLLDALGVTQNLGPQQFVGHLNMQRALAALDAGLDTPGRVLLTGASAGGLGALINFDATARTFTGSQLTLVDDSGPVPYDDNVLSPALMSQVVTLYNIGGAIPGQPQLFQSDGLPNLHQYYAATYPAAHFGLSSYLGDGTFRFFYGFGQPDGQITAAEYAAGMRDLNAKAPADWGTFFAEGEAHTFLLVPDRFTSTSAGVRYDTWLGGIIGGSAQDVDPGAAARLAAR